ncbi:MAG: YdcF family protein [Polyangiaceae bacterium]
MPSGAFDDADALESGIVTSADLARTLGPLFRADVSGVRPGAVESTLAASPNDRAQLLLALADALADPQLVAWIEADPARRARAVAIARAVAPRDPAAALNAATFACISRFAGWSGFAWGLLVVPGYTPLDQRDAKPGVHPVAVRRLQMAVEDYRARKAPFLLVSGGNVYPRGTPYFEGVEMHKALCAMGVPPEHILVDAFARHTTTNLRNAGRIMRLLRVDRAVVVTRGGGAFGSDVFGQDFYLAHPDLSTFHARCRRELGYEVGQLRGVGEGRIELIPSPSVDRRSYHPLDP